ncbi:MAG: hypothetical protein GMKNLPBB_00551 [Myxococcota bacterium]|nr:hypothetical protein [Myxococcota bacterium]
MPAFPDTLDERIYRAMVRFARQDRADIEAAVKALEGSHPGESRRELAERLIERISWQAGAGGAVAGLPGATWLGGGLRMANSLWSFRLQWRVAAGVAACLTPALLEDEEGFAAFVMMLVLGLEDEWAAGLAGSPLRLRRHARREMARRIWDSFFIAGFGARRIPVVRRLVPVVASVSGARHQMRIIEDTGERAMRALENQLNQPVQP